jgi:hypothetical protein
MTMTAMGNENENEKIIGATTTTTTMIPAKEASSTKKNSVDFDASITSSRYVFD